MQAWYQIRDWLRSKKKIIFTALSLPLVVIFVYLVLDRYVIPLPHIAESRIHLLTAPFIELLFIFLLFEIHDRWKNRTEYRLDWLLALVFFTANIGVSFAFREYYISFPGRDTQPLRFILAVAPLAIGIFTIGALLSFWMSTKNLKQGHWLDLSTRLPDAGQKTRLFTLAILAGCFLVGLGLRLYNLGGFPPYVDEYIHTRGASALLNGGEMTWSRAYLTVTLPVYLSYLTFGVNLFTGRLPMVLLNMLAIFPLYTLGKKINRVVGYLCVILFTFSPWVIASSRTVREYAIAPLVMFVTAVILIDLLEWEGLNLVGYLRKNLFRILAVGGILWYSLFDNLSNIRIVTALYAIAGAVMVLKIFKVRFHPLIKALVIIAGFALFYYALYRSGVIFRYINTGSISYKQSGIYWSTIINSSIHQWYWRSELGYGVVLLAGLMAFRSFFKQNSRQDSTFLFIAAAFAAHIFYFTYFMGSRHVPLRMRYGVLMEFWYLPIVAVILWTVYRLLRSTLRKIHPVWLILPLFVLFTNFQSIWDVISYQGGGTQRITGEKHYIVEPAYEYLLQHVTDQDVLLSDFVHSYDNIKGQQFHARDYYSYYQLILHLDVEPISIIEENPRGWVALSENANPINFGFMQEDFVHDGKQVYYRGRMGEIYVWQWVEIGDGE